MTDLDTNLNTLRKSIEALAVGAKNGCDQLIVDKPEYKTMIRRLIPGDEMAVENKGDARTISRCLKALIGVQERE